MNIFAQAVSVYRQRNTGYALMFWWGGYLLVNFPVHFSYRSFLLSLNAMFFSLYGLAVAAQGAVARSKAKAAAQRVFALITRQSKIDPLSDDGHKELVPVDKQNGHGKSVNSIPQRRVSAKLEVIDLINDSNKCSGNDSLSLASFLSGENGESAIHSDDELGKSWVQLPALNEDEGEGDGEESIHGTVQNIEEQKECTRSLRCTPRSDFNTDKYVSYFL